MKPLISLRRFALAAGFIVVLALRCEARDCAVVKVGAISVEARISEKDPLVVTLSITNGSSTDLIIDKSQVPWTSYYALTLKAFRVDALNGQLSVLSRSKPIADPPPGVLRVPRYEAASGSISLKRSFADIEKALSDRDILLFWSFEIGYGEAKKLFHGTLLIHSPGG